MLQRKYDVPWLLQETINEGASFNIVIEKEIKWRMHWQRQVWLCQTKFFIRQLIYLAMRKVLIGLTG